MVGNAGPHAPLKLPGRGVIDSDTYAEVELGEGTFRLLCVTLHGCFGDGVFMTNPMENATPPEPCPVSLGLWRISPIIQYIKSQSNGAWRGYFRIQSKWVEKPFYSASEAVSS